MNDATSVGACVGTDQGEISQSESDWRETKETCQYMIQGGWCHITLSF